ncbi:MAG: putative sugar nucleotidyl transferase [Pirellulales bacterium]
MTILVFEDASVDLLHPITTGRPALAITVASYRLFDLLKMLGRPLVGLMRPYLREIQRADWSDVLFADDPDLRDSSGPTLAVNARVVPSASSLRSLQNLVATSSSRGGIVRDGNHIVAVVNPGWTWADIIAAADGGIESRLLALQNLPTLDASLKVMTYPHEVISANMHAFHDNMELRIAGGDYVQKQDGVFFGEGAKLGEYVLCDTSKGPIIVDRGAQVGPYTLLRGPIYIGPNSKILEHAAIKDEVSLGHTTKVGGEVEAAVIEPYSNKQHHGFLGHSYLGSWINLGAGTCNSDLKNTYGTVNMEYASGKAATGMQFLGCVMGDYSKTAINTGIFTGKVIGVCSMMYGFVTGNVPSFVNYARLFGQMTTLPPDIMTATQHRMFSRRKVVQRPCDLRLINDMFRLTQSERDRFGDALSF